MSLFISIVTFNNEKHILRTLNSLCEQTNQNFTLNIIDNNSQDRTCSLIREFINRNDLKFEVRFESLTVNLGFAAGQNRSVYSFLHSPRFDWICFLNPDLRLRPDAIEKFFNKCQDNSNYIVTPKLLRADDNLQPIEPILIDAAGMSLTTSIRHLDRGSNGADIFHIDEIVFGGTGACLFISKMICNKLIISGLKYESDKYLVYPQLDFESEKRELLFDEAFFAYREDADLCWRASLLDIKTKFIPEIIGFHKRSVLPTKRKEYASTINAISVLNRFLLQINNYRFNNSISSLLNGVIVRNIIVIFGALFIEYKSFVYLKNLFKLYKRAKERRNYIVLVNKKYPRII
jgi:GT2 family glycosyltransferase